MRNLGYLKDTSFLRELDNDSNKFYWVKITVLDQNEGPIQSIEGQVLPGSVISIDGTSSVRRTCNITFLAEDANNDLTNIDNLLSVNKKIEVLVGIENHISSEYEDIIWFPQGIYVIVQPTITNNLNSCTIQLTCKDKMSLLNGECAGNLPASVTFHEYDQTYGYKECGYNFPDNYINQPNDYTVYGYSTPQQNIEDYGIVYIASEMPDYVDPDTGEATISNPDPYKIYKYICGVEVDCGTNKDPVKVVKEPNDYTIYTYIEEIDIDDDEEEEVIVSTKMYKWWSKTTGWSDGEEYISNHYNDPRYKSWGEKNGWVEVENENIKRYRVWQDKFFWSEGSQDMIGTISGRPNKIYDIIRTLVCNYGGESLSKIFIADIPLEMKQIVRWNGDENLYYYEYYPTPSVIDPGLKYVPFYTTKLPEPLTDDMPEEELIEAALAMGLKNFRIFKKDEDCGYTYTDFTYPGKLISNLGDNICSVLDKIKDVLGNFEYFYDINGNFVFQEIKNYFNNSYSPVDSYRIDNGNNPDAEGRRIELAPNGLSILNGANYEVDFNGSSKSIYTFEETTGLISAYTNAPSYTNLKNDFHIWGRKDDKIALHYHLVIKQKPMINTRYNEIVIMKNPDGTMSDRIRLVEDEDNPEYDYIISEYTPADWRAELFIRGLEDRKLQIRPDMYEQELLDMFEEIYDFSYYDVNTGRFGKFKTDLVRNPNQLTYFLDFLEPYGSMTSCCEDALKSRIYSYQQDKIRRLFNTYIPNVIIIDPNWDETVKQEMENKCLNEGGQPYTDMNNDPAAHDGMVEGTRSYTAQETARELLYQYTNYNETITIQCVPIYYLEPNTRITVYNQKAGISGDYIIKSISLPIDVGGTMTINAIRALERI